MPQIDWEFRKDGTGSPTHVFVSIDGTDFRIKEPHPFQPGWYSVKFRGPAVRYEVGICIATGWIVWVFGPFRAGKNDHLISQEGVDLILDHGERYIADKIYASECAINPYDAWNNADSQYMTLVRGRHETINRLFKQFKSIANTFRRDPAKHGLFMYSIANIIQVGIMFGEIQTFAIDIPVPDTPTFAPR